MKLRNLPASLLISSTLILSVGSCTTQHVQDDQSITFSNIKITKSYSLNGSAKSFAADNDLIFTDSVSILIPSNIGNVDIKPLQDSILKIAFDTIGDNHTALIDKYLVDKISDFGFETTECEISSHPYISDGFEIITGMIVNLSPDILVYCVSNESMMPRAAHGMTVKNYINFIPDNGKILSLNDIFTPDGLTELPDIIAKRAAEQIAILGPTEVNKLPENGNFYISPSAEIVFVYQPYEIASFAQGIIEISFYPYELVSYMTSYATHYFRLTDMVQ